MVDKSAPRFGSPHRHYARTDSTNRRARELAAAGAPNGTIVTAGEQTAGRGRQGRAWIAPPSKALLYSAIVRPLEDRHTMLPLAVPLAVCEAAEQLRPDLDCKVKWPNDVHIEGRKLAGILIEARPQDGWAVVGVGLNLTISREEFPPELRDTATSIFNPGHRAGEGGSAGPSPLLSAGPPLLGPSTATEALNQHLAKWVAAKPAEVLATWSKRDALRGRKVTWDGGSGVADGVDDRGYLVVVTPAGGRIAVGAGEVHLTSF
jgi:BirA family biotin operon repressor/biotin-[acetyl-CoA-carboxylase] ligase